MRAVLQKARVASVAVAEVLSPHRSSPTSKRTCAQADRAHSLRREMAPSSCSWRWKASGDSRSALTSPSCSWMTTQNPSREEDRPQRDENCCDFRPSARSHSVRTPAARRVRVAACRLTSVRQVYALHGRLHHGAMTTSLSVAATHLQALPLQQVRSRRRHLCALHFRQAWRLRAHLPSSCLCL